MYIREIRGLLLVFSARIFVYPLFFIPQFEWGVSILTGPEEEENCKTAVCEAARVCAISL